MMNYEFCERLESGAPIVAQIVPLYCALITLLDERQGDKGALLYRHHATIGAYLQQNQESGNGNLVRHFCSFSQG